MKKFYKKLALKCHPDRVDDKTLNFYFVESQKAMKDRKLTYLLFLIIKAGIKLNIEEDHHVGFVQSELETLEKDIKNLIEQVEWKWNSVKVL